MPSVLVSAADKLDILLRILSGDDSAVGFLHAADGRASVKWARDALLRMAEGEEAPPTADHLAHMLVRPSVEGRQDALSHVRSWLKGGERVLVCDPYLFKEPTAAYPSNEAYVEALLRLLPSSARDVTLCFDGYAEAIRKLLWPRLKEGRNVTLVNTNRVHDRFVSRDGAVKIVGTSFGGLGNKFSVVADLNADDARDVLASLEGLKAVARERTRVSRSEEAIWIPVAESD